MSTLIRRCGVLGAIGALLAVMFATGALAQTSPLVDTANNPAQGSILVNAQGMTLYYLTSELAGHLACTDKCLGFWPPLTLPTGTTSPTESAGITGNIGVLARPEGFSQVTFNGYPLYTFSKDSKPGDTHGNGIQAFGGVWYVAHADSVPLSATPAARLTVHITATGGIVWGKVTVNYVLGGNHVQQTCSSATCRLAVPVNVPLHLTQSPKNGSSWPFQHWKVVSTPDRPRISAHPSLHLNLGGNSTVNTVYRTA